MRAMAYKFFSYLKSHPLITAISLLLLFTLPILHMLMFFWPLIVSTVLGVLAVISFGRHSDEHAPPIAGCGTAETTAWQPDNIAFPSHEENISNVLMVGNQEVTWLEWLHNEDTQKLCAQERVPAVWDAYGCDGSTMASAFTCMDEALQAKDKGRLYACGSRGEGQTHVSALVSTEDNEPMVVVPPSTVLGGFVGTAIVIEEGETEMMNAPILTAEEESNLDLTGEDHTRRCGTTLENDITESGNRESNTDARACAEGDKGHVEGLCLPRGGGNECKAMQGSLDSTIHTKNKVNGYPSAGEDEVAAIVESTNECNSVTNSLESTIDMESTLNKCVLKGEHGASPTLEESTAHISHTSELKTADTHEQHAMDLQFSNKTVSPVVEVKVAEVHEMRHVQQDQAERGSNPLETQGPQWDVSDGEEDRSSLRFSFFHNSSLTPSEA